MQTHSILRCRWCALAAAAVFAAGAGARAEPIWYQAEPDQVLATYEVSVGRSRVSGSSRALNWTISHTANGDADVRLEMIVDSFDTGHPDVDAAVRSAMAAAQFPVVRIEGTARPGDSQLHGSITLHGVSLPLTAKLVQSRIDDKLLLRATLTVSLAAFGVSPPPLAAGQMGDSVDVTVLALLSVHPDSVLSGGALRARHQDDGAAGYRTR